MNFKWNYPINILTNHFNKFTFSTMNLRSTQLNPWFITGFSDAESSFSISIKPDVRLKTKWRISPVFIIQLHKKDFEILEFIQNTLGVGKLRYNVNDCVQYVVESFKELEKIIEHFDNYPIITSKLNNYKLFKLAYNLFINKENLSIEGIEKLLAIKSSMNLGLNPELKVAFPQISNHKDIYKDCFAYSNIKKIPDPYWVSGFTSGEGSFMIDIIKS